MYGLDRVYQAVESELGIETYSSTQMADALPDQSTTKIRNEHAPPQSSVIASAVH
jgi:hypothetical protein